MAKLSTKAVELKGITKRFGTIVANNGVDLDLRKGEVHALLGENGAGKSTLMQILSGRYRPDSGEIWVHGEPARFRSPQDAIQRGIGMIHQHFMLERSQTVLENVILGTKLPFWLHRRRLAREVSAIYKRLDYSIDLHARIWQLSMGEQQVVEIVKVLYRGARVLILDEPTAVLTPQESERLFRVLRSMRDEGYAIVFVSHKLEQVLAISDRITVLRKGNVVCCLPNSDVQKQHLAEVMVGRAVALSDPVTRHVPQSKTSADPLLKLEQVTGRNDRYLVALDHVSLELHSGEILGIAGVAGNGQLELAEVITGLRPVEAGRIWFGQTDITTFSVRDRLHLGFAYVPEDRVGIGSVAALSVRDNILLREYNRFSFLDTTSVDSYVGNLMGQYNVAYPSLASPVRHLSGGNLQKLILARELGRHPKLLVAAYPIRGLDISAIEYVHQTLLECRDRGTAILLISEELDELIALSDRIGVLYEGRLTMMSVSDPKAIGMAMAGMHASE